jgi:hypothetical protein
VDDPTGVSVARNEPPVESDGRKKPPAVKFNSKSETPSVRERRV